MIKKTKICITGARGFIGKNLLAHLKIIEGLEIRTIDRNTPISHYAERLADVDIIYHLAGVNRSDNIRKFTEVNVDLTKHLLNILKMSEKRVKLIVSSSSQAVLDNVYGRSKLASEVIIREVCSKSLVNAVIYRLPGVFGKWSKPNYNSVVATFCYNVANDIILDIRDPQYAISLVYIDDVVNAFLAHLYAENNNRECLIYKNIPVQFNTTLGELADIIQSFKESRNNLEAPDIGNLLIKNLYSTYVSFLPRESFDYEMEVKSDIRGNLYEWIKSKKFGQIFISTTKPGITRGNHFHHSKTEKFLVIRGQAEIKFRKIDEDEIVTYHVNGENPRVVDIPTGYTHNITNIGTTELITLFWANEIFNASKPDTNFLIV